MCSTRCDLNPLSRYTSANIIGQMLACYHIHNIVESATSLHDDQFVIWSLNTFSIMFNQIDHNHSKFIFELHFGFFAECPSIFISGTEYQTSREGKYQMTEGTCNGRSVYIHSEGDNYLYFISGTSSNHWLVGSESCSSYGFIQAYDSATYPQDITAVWQEYNGMLWRQNGNIKVECGMKMLLTYFLVRDIINSRFVLDFFIFRQYLKRQFIQLKAHGLPYFYDTICKPNYFQTLFN